MTPVEPTYLRHLQPLTGPALATRQGLVASLLMASTFMAPVIADQGVLTCGGFGVVNSAVPAPLAYVPSPGVQAIAEAASAAIVPLAANGSPSSTGKIGIVLWGQSTAESIEKDMRALWKNTIANNGWKQYFNPKIVIVLCAKGGDNVTAWMSPGSPSWTRCSNNVTAAGLTWAQVQVMFGLPTEIHTFDPTTGATITTAQVESIYTTSLGKAPNLKKFVTMGIHSTMFCTPREDAMGNPLTWAQMDAICKLTEQGAFADNVLLAGMAEGGGHGISFEYQDSWAGPVATGYLEAKTPSGFVLAADYVINPRNGSGQCGGGDLVSDGIHQTPQLSMKQARSIWGRMMLDPGQAYLIRNATVALP